MVSQTKSNIKIVKSFQKISYDLSEVNKTCWGSFLTDPTVGFTKFQDTEWEVEEITGRVVADQRVKYELLWKEKNGRVFNK